MLIGMGPASVFPFCILFCVSGSVVLCFYIWLYVSIHAEPKNSSNVYALSWFIDLFSWSIVISFLQSNGQINTENYTKSKRASEQIGESAGEWKKPFLPGIRVRNGTEQRGVNKSI